MDSREARGKAATTVGKVTVEICVDSVESGVQAEAGGADRVELCAALVDGGTTPSVGTLMVLRQRLRIPIHVLIRPRPGDFLYDDVEVAVMLKDIEAAGAHGADGIVIGALLPSGDVDIARMTAFIAAARPMSVTFHRAIDMSADPVAALRAVARLGCDRVLSSGRAPGAELGLPCLRRMVAESAEAVGVKEGGVLPAETRAPIAVMAGGGITAANVAAIVRATGVREVHASARIERSGGMVRDARIRGWGGRRAPGAGLLCDPPLFLINWLDGSYHHHPQPGFPAGRRRSRVHGR
jgi:copper homeostasis protein